MIREQIRMVAWAAGIVFICGCDMTRSNEVVILLPGQVKGAPLVLGETSATNISINGTLVPSLILAVWWNDEIIITQNHPMKPRNKFPGDLYQVVNRTVLCWYVVHPRSDSVQRYDDYSSLMQHIETLGVDPSKVKLLNLYKAQRLREKQLGFKFTAATVNRFVRSKEYRAMNESRDPNGSKRRGE